MTLYEDNRATLLKYLSPGFCIRLSKSIVESFDWVGMGGGICFGSNASLSGKA